MDDTPPIEQHARPAGEARGPRSDSVFAKATRGGVTLEPRYNPPVEGKDISLMSKLSEVMAEIEPVPMNATTDRGDPYATEGDIYRAVKALLAKRRVMMLTAELARSHRKTEYTKNDGAIITTPLVDVLVRFSFYDGESGETYVFHMVGTRPDRDGTGGAQAITTAIRTALIKTFMIPVAEGEAGSAQSAASGRQTDSGGRGGSQGAQNRETGVQRAAPVFTLAEYVVSIGRQKGQKLGEHSDQNLKWLLSLAPPDNDRYRSEHDQRRALLEREATRRGWVETPAEAVDASPPVEGAA